MTAVAELELIRAADAVAGDFSRDTEVMFTSQAARHRRTVLRLLDEARAELADTAARLAKAEAEVERLNIEMLAYRQKCTPDNAKAMKAVMDALYAEKQLRVTGSLPPLDVQEFCEGCPPTGYPTDETRCAPCPRRMAALSPAPPSETP